MINTSCFFLSSLKCIKMLYDKPSFPITSLNTFFKDIYGFV